MSLQEPKPNSGTEEPGIRVAGLAILLRDAGFVFQDSDIAAIEADRQSVRQRIDAMGAAFSSEERARS